MSGRFHLCFRNIVSCHLSYLYDSWSYNRIAVISTVVHTPNNVLFYQEHLLHDEYACSKVSPHEYRILYSVHVFMYCIAFITQTVPDLFHYSELIHWYCSEEKSFAIFEMIDYEVFLNEKIISCLNMCIIVSLRENLVKRQAINRIS